jgi:hypothetical protein
MITVISSYLHGQNTLRTSNNINSYFRIFCNPISFVTLYYCTLDVISNLFQMIYIDYIIALKNNKIFLTDIRLQK